MASLIFIVLLGGAICFYSCRSKKNKNKSSVKTRIEDFDRTVTFGGIVSSISKRGEEMLKKRNEYFCLAREHEDDHEKLSKFFHLGLVANDKYRAAKLVLNDIADQGICEESLEFAGWFYNGGDLRFYEESYFNTHLYKKVVKRANIIGVAASLTGMFSPFWIPMTIGAFTEGVAGAFGWLLIGGFISPITIPLAIILGPCAGLLLKKMIVTHTNHKYGVYEQAPRPPADIKKSLRWTVPAAAITHELLKKDYSKGWIEQ